MPMIMRGGARIVVHRCTSGAVSDHSVATALPFAKVYAGVKPTVSSMPLDIYAGFATVPDFFCVIDSHIRVSLGLGEHILHLRS